MTCLEFNEWLDDLLVRETDELLPADVARHRAECTECARLHAIALEAVAALKPPVSPGASQEAKHRILGSIPRSSPFRSGINGTSVEPASLEVRLRLVMSDASRRARDELIALRCRLGEPGAFADLVRELESPLLYYTTKILRDEHAALDVLQNVWITAFRKLRQFEDPAVMRVWLYRIAHGLAIDRLRQDRSQKRSERERAANVFLRKPNHKE
jgi:Sigma-70 region 2